MKNSVLKSLLLGSLAFGAFSSVEGNASLRQGNDTPILGNASGISEKSWLSQSIMAPIPPLDGVKTSDVSLVSDDELPLIASPLGVLDDMIVEDDSKVDVPSTTETKPEFEEMLTTPEGIPANIQQTEEGIPALNTQQTVVSEVGTIESSPLPIGPTAQDESAVSIEAEVLVPTDAPDINIPMPGIPSLSPPLSIPSVDRSFIIYYDKSVASDGTVTQANSKKVTHDELSAMLTELGEKKGLIESIKENLSSENLDEISKALNDLAGYMNLHTKGKQPLVLSVKFAQPEFSASTNLESELAVSTKPAETNPEPELAVLTEPAETNPESELAETNSEIEPAVSPGSDSSKSGSSSDSSKQKSGSSKSDSSKSKSRSDSSDSSKSKSDSSQSKPNYDLSKSGSSSDSD